MAWRRRFLSFLQAIVVPAVAATAAPAWAADAAPRPIGGLLAAAPVWADWSARFLRDSGRVVDTAGGGVSHSEGQGFGMLLAVAADDRAAFDRIWGWTRRRLAVRSDRLMAWRWDPAAARVVDRNNATDGDVLIAWALGEAAAYWQAPAYRRAGAAIARDIGRKLVVDAVGVGPVLLPARFGFASGDQPDGPVVNLSYWVFPAFSRLAELAPGVDWDGVRRSGLALIDALQTHGAGVPSDWTGLADGKAAPADRFPARAGYDALRLPLYLSFAPAANAARLRRTERSQELAGEGLTLRNARTGAAEGVARGRGYAAIGFLRACAVSGRAYPDAFYALGARDPYYPATLHMMALLAALSRPSACLDPALLRTSHAPRTPPSASPWRIAADLRPPSPSPAVAQSPERRSAFADAGLPPSRISRRAEGGMRRPAVASAAIGATIGLAALACAIVLALARRRPAPSPLPPAHGSAAGGQPVARSPAPRELARNPFGAIRSARALEERLDIAARTSRIWRRTAAIAYFRFAAADAAGPKDVEATRRTIVEALSQRIRKSDAVAEISECEIVVCLSLIADEADLESVGSRLAAAVAAVHPRAGASRRPVGLALYPPREGAGAECLAMARAAFERDNPDAGPRPPVAASPKPRPRAAARRAGGRRKSASRS